MAYEAAPSTAFTILPNDSESANRCSVPTTINASGGSLLFLINSSELAMGTISSASECRIVVFGLTVVAAPPSFPCRAEEDEGNVSGVDVHCHCTATGTAYDNIGLMLVELGLGDFQGGVEIVVGEMGVEDFVAVVYEVGRLSAARCRLPAVEEEDLHGALPLNVHSQRVGRRVELFAN